MFSLKIKSTESLEAAASQLLEAFPDKRIFAFYGEMGAGKTTFIKALCKVLKVGDVTSSPSFGLIHEYLSEGGDSIYHFDFYRIERVEEVFDIGYEEYMYSGEYCFLEWPEQVEAILPEETVRLSLSTVEGGIRELQELG
ncbi:tRNA (adenosine(37)-N6)-threonylcarbamoyltransferase complex ATPase subunit type 1 TsaE [Bacteroidota bacterium]